MSVLAAIWVLWQQFLKAIVIFEIGALKFSLLQKPLNLGPTMSDLRIFGLELQNIIVIFEISSFEFAVMEKKCLNLIPKMPALCMLGLEF